MKTIHETAELFGVTPVTIKAWMKAGYITGSKVGGKYFFTEKDIANCLRKNKVKA